jgi:endo-1,4-beta-xylanase
LAPPYLNDLAKAAGKLYFGSATDQPGTIEDDSYLYQEILNETRIFGQVTPANGMKFFATEPENNVFNYTMGDVAVGIAQDHGKVLRCHNLVWNSQLSDFVINGTWTAETLTEVMRNHITTLITHWQDVCYAWDVINEALASNGSFSSSIWYDTIGPDYFHLAYQFAQEAVEATGKDIKLYYNDYGIENPNNKSSALVGLIKDLQARNIRIDGVGHESHFIIGNSPSYAQQVANMKTWTGLGLEVAITELDVRFEEAATARTNTTGLAIQAQNYYDSVKACVDVDGCVGITVWDFWYVNQTSRHVTLTNKFTGTLPHGSRLPLQAKVQLICTGRTSSASRHIMLLPKRLQDNRAAIVDEQLEGLLSVVAGKVDIASYANNIVNDTA